MVVGCVDRTVVVGVVGLVVAGRVVFVGVVVAGCVGRTVVVGVAGLVVGACVAGRGITG